MANVLSKKTLIPASLVISAIIPAVRWAVGLEKDLRAAEMKIGDVRTDQSILSAEIISQLRSQGLAIQEIDIRGQRTEERVNLLIRMIDRKNRHSDDH